MNEYDIWMEGFELDFGASEKANFLDKATGENFKLACKSFFTREDGKLDPNYSFKKNSYWGARLFSNERAARKAHG